jgi:hypothetical protein
MYRQCMMRLHGQTVHDEAACTDNDEAACTDSVEATCTGNA